MLPRDAFEPFLGHSRRTYLRALSAMCAFASEGSSNKVLLLMTTSFTITMDWYLALPSLVKVSFVLNSGLKWRR